MPDRLVKSRLLFRLAVGDDFSSPFLERGESVPDNPSILDRCPYCGVHHVQIQNAWEGNSPGKSADNWRIVYCSNPGCNRYTLLRNDEGRLFQYPPGKFDLPTDPKIPAGVPGEYNESATCLAIGCHLASMTMSRRVLQRCLKQQGFNEKTPDEQIEAAKADGKPEAILCSRRRDSKIRQHRADPDDDNLALATAENAHTY